MDDYKNKETASIDRTQQNNYLDSLKETSMNGASDILLDILCNGEEDSRGIRNQEDLLNGKENNSETSSDDEVDSVDSDASEAGGDFVEDETSHPEPPEPDRSVPVENGEPVVPENSEEDAPRPNKRKRTRKKKSPDDGNAKKRPKTKRKKKKANMRRNLKETTLKQLNPNTFSAHNEELERMLRIGQMDGYVPSGDQNEYDLPPSIMALLKGAGDPDMTKDQHQDTKSLVTDTTEDKPLAMETDFPTDHNAFHRPTIATYGEPSSSQNDKDGCRRIHKEASSGPGEPVPKVKEQDVIILDDSDSDTGQDVTKSEGAPPSQVRTSTQSSKPLDWKRKYLGLDLVDQQSVVARDPSKVLINPGHPPSESDVLLAPQITVSAKLHQIGGIRFLYDNIIENLDRFSKSDGFGCILAHSMGLGKTLQAIGFTDLFLRYTPSKHVLIVVPVNTMMNWLAEFDHWLPAAKETPSPAQPAAEDKQPDSTFMPRSFPVFALNDSSKTMIARVAVIREWREKGGVLLIGYEMYRLLSMSVPSIAGNKMAVKKRRRKKKNDTEADPGVIDLDKTEKEMDELIEIQEALCRPGPDLVICDEGHRIRNETTNLSQSLKLIRTRRRVVMTGYPLQNNLIEYWCMVDFVRPSYLGDRKEFQTLFERPIVNGQCIDSSPEDVRLMRKRCHVLYQSLKGFVLRCDHSILKCSLPAKYESVLYLRPSAIQKKLYDYVYECARTSSTTNVINPIVAFSTFSKIWNHPEIFHEASLNSSKGGKATASLNDIDIPSKEKEVPLLADWPSGITDYQSMSLENSTKFTILMSIIDFSVALGEKVLVFSQSLSTLSLIERFLGLQAVPNSRLSQNGTIEYTDKKWKKGLHYYRLDGSTSMSDRESMIDSFNSPKNTNAWVFLLSTRAGCLGINLVAASRVVMVDVSWNPCHDAQAVCRVYRFGQTKATHIYRLVLDGTMEKKMYQRQISKQGMSGRVVDELNPERNLARSDIESLVEPPESLPEVQNFSEDLGKFAHDVILMSLCHHFGHMLTKLPFEHESLLLDQDEDQLTETEKLEAIKDFQTERDRTRRAAVYAVPGPSNVPVHGKSTVPPTTQPTKVMYNEYMMNLAAQQKETMRYPPPPNVAVGLPPPYPTGPPSTISTQAIPPPVNGYVKPSFTSSSSSWPQVTMQQSQPYNKFLRPPGGLSGGLLQGTTQGSVYGARQLPHVYNSTVSHGLGAMGPQSTSSQNSSFLNHFSQQPSEPWSRPTQQQQQVVRENQRYDSPNVLVSQQSSVMDDIATLLNSDKSFDSPGRNQPSPTDFLTNNSSLLESHAPADVQELMQTLFS